MAAEHREDVEGLSTRWLESAGEHPILYVHGVPNGAEMWQPFLERTGGVAPDLPGFGASAKPADFAYSIAGYASWLDAFSRARGLERFSLVVHDWGAAALALAQSAPERIERLVLIDAVPLLPGYRWHRLAGRWRQRVVGELTMGFTLKSAMRRSLGESTHGQFPQAELDEIWSHFDHGTQRAILKLYRSAPESVLEQAGSNLAAIGSPALVVWGGADRYIAPTFAEDYAEALGGDAHVSVHPDAGHWPWLDEPSVIDEVAAFLTA